MAVDGKRTDRWGTQMLTQQDAENASGKATRREWIGLAVLALPCILYALFGHP